MSKKWKQKINCGCTPVASYCKSDGNIYDFRIPKMSGNLKRKNKKKHKRSRMKLAFWELHFRWGISSLWILSHDCFETEIARSRFSEASLECPTQSGGKLRIESETFHLWRERERERERECKVNFPRCCVRLILHVFAF